MKVTLDVNVLIDVFQRRQPYYTASAQVIDLVQIGALDGVCPAHDLTTIYYLIRKYASKPEAEAAMDGVLDYFHIGNLDADGWREARRLSAEDFEDAAVAIVAKTTGSAFIITRNTKDFARSPVPAITPADFLDQFDFQA